MKKLITLWVFVISSLSLFAQRPNASDDTFVRKGRILVETGYNLFAGFGPGGTGITSYANDDSSITSLGAEGGYFITENLALKIAISVLSVEDEALSSTSLGVKYYIIGKIPVDLTFGRISVENQSSRIGNFSLGYAFRLADNITLEPSLGALFGDEDGVGKVALKFAMFL